MSDPTRELRRLRQTLPRATRTALESSFKLWHERFAPFHFERAAFARYAQRYAASAKRNFSEYSERHSRQLARGRQTTNPLEKSGAFKRSFLSGGYRFGAGLKRLHVTFPGLPRHVYRRNPFNTFSVAEAIMQVTEPERQAMKRHFIAQLAFQLKQMFARRKTFGRAVFNV